jgi:CDP-diacylglycerol--serine O-phosphatidyltransferase
MEDKASHAHDRVVPRRKGLRRFQRIPMRFVLPNLVTLLAICIGLTGVRFAIEGHFDMAVYAIIVAAILDGLDGRIARALKGTSRFGAELDSLADFVDFGVAPALVLYLWALHEHRSFGWFAALIFAIAGALRLARFNVMIDDPNKPAWSANFFVGMPAPAGAVLVMLPIYLHFGVDMPNDRAYVPFEIAYVLFIAFLMASRIPHFSGKRVGRVPREWFIPVLLGAIAALLLILTYPMQMLIVMSLAYLALIPLSVRRFLAYQHEDEMAAGQGTDGQEAPPSAPAGGH